MSRTGVVVSVVLALALAVAAYFLLGPRGAGGGGGAGAPLLPFQPSEISSLEVQPPGGEPSRVANSGLFDGWVLWPRSDPEVGAWPVHSSNVQGALRMLMDVRRSEGAEGDGGGGEVRVALRAGGVWTLRFDSAPVAGVQRLRAVDPEGAAIAGSCEVGVADALLRPGPRAWRQSLALPALGPGLESVRVEAEGRRVTLRRAAGGWIVSDPVVAAADERAVGDLVRTLASLRLEGAPEGPGRPVEMASGSVEVTARVGGGTLTRRIDFGPPADLAGKWVMASISVRDSAGAAGETAWVWEARVDREAAATITPAPEPYLARTAWAGDTGSVGGLECSRRDGGSTRLRRGLDGWMRDGAPLLGEERGYPDKALALLASEPAGRVEVLAEPAGGATLRVLSLGGEPLAEFEIEESEDGGVTVSSGRVRRAYRAGAEAVRWLMRGE